VRRSARSWSVAQRTRRHRSASGLLASEEASAPSGPNSVPGPTRSAVSVPT
jgi:hypothetical protein